jgi:hypothetical protein
MNQTFKVLIIKDINNRFDTSKHIGYESNHIPYINEKIVLDRYSNISKIYIVTDVIFSPQINAFYVDVLKL